MSECESTTTVDLQSQTPERKAALKKYRLIKRDAEIQFIRAIPGSPRAGWLISLMSYCQRKIEAINVSWPIQEDIPAQKEDLRKLIQVLREELPIIFGKISLY